MAFCAQARNIKEFQAWYSQTLFIQTLIIRTFSLEILETLEFFETLEKSSMDIFIQTLENLKKLHLKINSSGKIFFVD